MFDDDDEARRGWDSSLVIGRGLFWPCSIIDVFSPSPPPSPSPSTSSSLLSSLPFSLFSCPSFSLSPTFLPFRGDKDDNDNDIFDDDDDGGGGAGDEVDTGRGGFTAGEERINQDMIPHRPRSAWIRSEGEKRSYH